MRSLWSAYLRWVSTKRLDVILHPLQRCKLVLEPEVEDTAVFGFRALWEPKDTNAVANAHVHNRRALVQRLSFRT